MKRYGKTRRKARRYKKKRRFSKRKQPLRSQRYCSARVDNILPLTGGGNPQANAIGFAWMQKEAVVSNIYGHTACARYQQLVRDYEQYAITGMRISWIPTNLRGAIATDLNN